MSLSYNLPFAADVIFVPGSLWAPSIDDICRAAPCVPTFADPCDRDARFCLVDEDGAELLKIELERG